MIRNVYSKYSIEEPKITRCDSAAPLNTGRGNGMPRNLVENSNVSGVSVTLREGQRFRCQNRECGCEIVVNKPSIEGDSLPKCCCGAAMKKPYNPPVIRTLNTNDQHVDAIRDLV